MNTELRARGPRSDSLRNRALILEAAEELFGTDGLAVPIDRIAERAGLGVGTLYRHFPTKEALFEAIVLQHFETLVSEATVLQDAEDAGDALFGFLERMVAVAVAKRDLAEALLGAGIDFKAAAGDLKAELDAAIEQLFMRAQAEGSIRPGVECVDLMGLVTGACMNANAFGALPSCPERMLDIVFAGMRAAPAS